MEVTNQWNPYLYRFFTGLGAELNHMDGSSTDTHDHGSVPPIFFLENGDGPLDLSATGSPLVDDVNIPQPKVHIELKVPQIKKTEKIKRDGGKRHYTEDELYSAVQEIRDGKIGTRRAAVLYGIPRSTLRNKIYKMDVEDANPNKALTMGDLLQNGHTALAFGLTNGNFMEFDSWEQKLEMIRRKHNLQSFGGIDLAEYGLLPEEMDFSKLPFANELKLPFLPELVRKMAEQRMQMEREKVTNDDNVDDDDHLADLSQGASGNTQHVSLKIPSYKPSRGDDGSEAIPAMGYNDVLDSSLAQDVASSNRIGETLKEIITKTITEKIRSRFTMGSYSPLAGYMNGHEEAPVQKLQPQATPSPAKRIRPKPMSAHKSSSSSSNSGSPEKPEKKTRPKRGQYRKYNNQLLMEAVRAVQRGEMSVHRAGSYFGVPHSTLEYKVKERHLLRKKKKEQEKLAQMGTGSDAPSSQSPKPQASTPPTAVATPHQVQYHASSQAVFPSPLPFLAWPMEATTFLPTPSLVIQNGLTLADQSDMIQQSGFALSTPASELLKKLQQKVQAGVVFPGQTENGETYNETESGTKDE
ncbi:mushroom body large-type Kenyon cell-specific protein 1-like isoform X2 [Lineus longissimus]|uniref:mushroom body large-type Kenyon cell-specific protein 1-like isoform X2 n=1 Tax=Lineus longissimus TaxID=88925 RepID=UPI00315C5052